MSRLALRLACGFLLLLGGLSSSFFAARSLAATATSTSTQSLTTTAPSALVISGHGWGHGLGLSQWGTYGYAKHGWTYDRILAHYYTGTTLGTVKATVLRVLVASEASSTVTATAAVTVTDKTGRKKLLAPGSFVFGADSVALDAAPALKPPFTLSSTQPLAVDSHPYRGKIVVSTDGKVLSVIDRVSLEQYLRGVVPSEMPSNWSPEALKAQTVAARTFAVYTMRKSGPFDLYNDSRDQQYGGVAAESPNTDAAIAATRGEVVLYKSKPADTMFFSTSGGRTASALESMGKAVPYLVPVVDPYDTLSPYHDWGPMLVDAATAATALNLKAPIADVRVDDGQSGRARTVTVVSTDDSQATFTGNAIRTALDLRSTWFTPSLLQLAPSAKTMTYGGALSLTGRARSVDGLSLESKTAAEPEWTSAGAPSVGPDGAFSVLVRPQVSTQYRLAWGDVRVGLSKITVAVRVEAAAGPGGISGSVHPLVSEATVSLQRHSGPAWTTVSTAPIDLAGGYSFVGVAAGTYRIRCAPGQGLAAGVSAPLVVS
ncbi:MAG TPA: SpoIID/LytB domain-containing protein [Gaiellaceae bacterium]|nr:SpoIID/LytB domain-containing protein [Gaiellaceae bacterium]